MFTAKSIDLFLSFLTLIYQQSKLRFFFLSKEKKKNPYIAPVSSEWNRGTAQNVTLRTQSSAFHLFGILTQNKLRFKDSIQEGISRIATMKDKDLLEIF